MYNKFVLRHNKLVFAKQLGIHCSFLTYAPCGSENSVHNNFAQSGELLLTGVKKLKKNETMDLVNSRTVSPSV